MSYAVRILVEERGRPVANHVVWEGKTYDEAFAVRDACHSAGLVETATVQTVDPVAVAEVREELKIAAPTTVLSPPKKRVRKKKKD